MNKKTGAIGTTDWMSFIGAILILACVFTPLSAQTYYVKSNGTGNGESWENASGDLQNILSISNFGTQIWVAKGTYFPTQNNDRTIAFVIPDGVQLFGGFLGNEKHLNQRQWTHHLTILSGEIGSPILEDNSSNVIITKNVSAATIVDGFHIIKGFALDPKKPLGHRNRSGGGWYNDGTKSPSNPTIRNCYFVENTAIDGGAIYNNAQNGRGDLNLLKCSFIQNIAYSDGGAIYNNSKNGKGQSQIYNCAFLNNEGQNGAAIFNQNNNRKKSLIIEYSIFHNNIAIANATIFDYSANKHGLLLNKCSLKNNSANASKTDLYFYHDRKKNRIFSSNNNVRIYKL